MLLLGEYSVNVTSALMPLAKMKDNDGILRIIGINPSPPYTDYLWGKLVAEVARIHGSKDIRTWSIESRTHVGTFYTVTRVTMDGSSHWGCTCPARSECWHIKMMKEINK